MSSVTPTINPDSIKVIAEMNGVPKLKHDIATLISNEFEYRLKHILEVGSARTQV